MVKNLPVNSEDLRDEGLILGSGRSPGGGHGKPLQCSCLENPMDRGAWWMQSMGLHRVGHDCSDLAHTHGSEETELTQGQRLRGVDKDGEMKGKAVRRGLRLRMSKAPSGEPTAGPSDG